MYKADASDHCGGSFLYCLLFFKCGLLGTVLGVRVFLHQCSRENKSPLSPTSASPSPFRSRTYPRSWLCFIGFIDPGWGLEGLTFHKCRRRALFSSKDVACPFQVLCALPPRAVAMPCVNCPAPVCSIPTTIIRPCSPDKLFCYFLVFPSFIF